MRLAGTEPQVKEGGRNLVNMIRVSTMFPRY
jgi:hypothetical protein